MTDLKFHTWVGDNSNSIYVTCKMCKLRILDFFKSENVSAISCSQMNLFASCGHTKGISIWNPGKQQFECSECQSPTSNDPSYLGSNVTNPPQWKSNECIHDWKQYKGLREQFDYCSKCDVKRG